MKEVNETLLKAFIKKGYSESDIINILKLAQEGVISIDSNGNIVKTYNQKRLHQEINNIKRKK